MLIFREAWADCDSSEGASEEDSRNRFSEYYGEPAKTDKAVTET